MLLSRIFFGLSVLRGLRSLSMLLPGISLWFCNFFVLPPSSLFWRFPSVSLLRRPCSSSPSLRHVGLLNYRPSLCLFLFLEFQAKTESEANRLPHSFAVHSLDNFVGDMEEELLLCPVRALRIYLQRTERLVLHPRTLFVSPRSSSCSLSKNAISFFLREVISQAYSSVSLPGPLTGPRAHSIWDVATFVSFLRNYSVRSVFESSCWKSASVFTSFYFTDVQFSFHGGFGLGPFVAANEVIS